MLSVSLLIEAKSYREVFRMKYGHLNFQSIKKLSSQEIVKDFHGLKSLTISIEIVMLESNIDVHFILQKIYD